MTDNHVDFRPNTQDEFIWNEVYTNNCYKLPDDMSGIAVIDIGANIGAFAIACLERNCDYVICYEPDKENYDILRSNLGRFDTKRWSIVNAAVVGYETHVNLGLSPLYENNNTILTGGRRLIPLKGLVPEIETNFDLIPIDHVGPIPTFPDSETWIKLDCEGCEHQIISSQYANWNNIARIIGEVHSCSDGITSLHANKEDLPSWYFGSLDGSVRAFVGHLMSLGYRVEIEANPDDERLFLFFANRKQDQDKDVEEFNREFAEMNERFYESLEDVKNDQNLKIRLSDEQAGYDTHDSLGSISKALAYAENLGLNKIPLEEKKLWNKIRPFNVAIITPFRNARKYLRLYFDQLSDLKSTLTQNGFNLHQLIACEGDSKDGTRERIIELSNEYNIPLNLIDTTHGHIKWSSVEDPIRMKVMSDVMNKGFSAIDDKTDIVVWIMSDLEWKVADVFGLILTAKQDENSIYAPCVFVGEGKNKQFYDTWAFRWKDNKRFGLREFCYSDDDETEIREINSAGTCLAMSRKVASNCRANNNEAVSFCENAINEGYSIRLLPWLSVNHAPEMKYKVLWIGDAICPSGFGRVTHSIVPLLTEMGCEVDIIGRNYFGEPHDFPYRIWPANVNGLYPGGEARAKILVASSRYDAVINLCDFWDVKGLLREFDDLRDNHNIDIPLVINWVMVDGKNADLGLEKISDNTTILACTEFGKNELGLNTQVCPFGVDRSIFRPLDKVECRKVVASVAPEDAFIFGTVCVNQQRKRLDLLLREFSLFVKNCDNPDNIFLYLCISHTDRENGYDLKKLVDYYGLKGKVFVNGSELPDELLAKVYNSFDVFVSITQGEGFGLCALEAMSCGVPCVLSNNSGYSSWAKDAALMVNCDEEIVTTPFNRMSYVVGSVPQKSLVARAMRISYHVINGISLDSEGSYSLLGMSKADSLSWQTSANILMSHIYQSKDLS